MFQRGSRHHHRQMEMTIQCEPDGDMAVGEQPVPRISKLDIRDVRGKGDYVRLTFFAELNVE